MKSISILFVLFFVSQFIWAQEWPKEITPQVLQKIKSEVEKQVPAFRQKLAAKGFNADQVEFSIDTFRIERIAEGRIDIDYSTAGMNTAVAESAEAYDKLLNKYYNKLLKLLKPEDKKELVAAQKAWMVYRDAEAKLIWTMTKEEYSGGGSMQTNIANGAYAALVERRTVELFNYYDEVIKEK